MIQTVDELRGLIHQHKLERWEEKIVALAKPAVAIQKLLTRGEDDIPIGASKLGGSPDLPEGVEWSFYQGKALTFIAQFKLSEVAPYDVEKILPERGMLYFFYEADEQPWGNYNEREAWKVIYFEDENAPLFRTQHPMQQGKWDTIKAFACYRLAYKTYVSLPRIFGVDAPKLGLDFTEDEFHAYWDVEKQRPHPDHHLLGNPLKEQDDLDWNCVLEKHQIRMVKDPVSNRGYYTKEDLAFIEREKSNWQFLFQIHSDFSPRMIWGETGTIYVCVPKESLRQRKFEDCWLILQCT